MGWRRGGRSSAPRHTSKQHLFEHERRRPSPNIRSLSAYYNMDNGTGRIRGIWLQENLAIAPIFRAWFGDPSNDLDVPGAHCSAIGQRHPIINRSTRSAFLRFSSCRIAWNTTRARIIRTWIPSIASSATIWCRRRSSSQRSPTKPPCAPKNYRAGPAPTIRRIPPGAPSKNSIEGYARIARLCRRRLQQRLPWLPINWAARILVPPSPGFSRRAEIRIFRRHRNFSIFGNSHRHPAGQQGPELAEKLDAVLNSDTHFNVLQLSRNPEGELSDDADPNREQSRRSHRMAAISRLTLNAYPSRPGEPKSGFSRKILSPFFQTSIHRPRLPSSHDSFLLSWYRIKFSKLHFGNGRR